MEAGLAALAIYADSNKQADTDGRDSLITGRIVGRGLRSGILFPTHDGARPDEDALHLIPIIVLVLMVGLASSVDAATGGHSYNENSLLPDYRASVLRLAGTPTPSPTPTSMATTTTTQANTGTTIPGLKVETSNILFVALAGFVVLILIFVALIYVIRSR